jgi:perosamine synthetase
MMMDYIELSQLITGKVKEVLGSPDGFVALHEPEFLGNEEELIRDCVRSTFVSSVGQYVDRFEREIASACGTEFGVAVVNGTAALEVALRVSGVQPNDEVLMPSLTFIATANATHHLGAVPHFVDSEERTLGLDPNALRRHLNEIAERRNGVTINGRTGRRLTSIVPMHVFGHPVDMDALDIVAKDFSLTIVEDAAEALGSSLGGRLCGSLGRVAAVSFNGNKIITTGGGGAIVTSDPVLAERAKHLTTTAKVPHKWAFYHDEIAYNYRMPNLNAALGVAQLAQLNDKLQQKRALAKQYIDAFNGLNDIYIFSEREDTLANYWLNTLVLSKEYSEARETILSTLNDAGIMSRPVWEPMHTLNIYSDCPRADLSVTEDLARRIINLPSSAKFGSKNK